MGRLWVKVGRGANTPLEVPSGSGPRPSLVPRRRAQTYHSATRRRLGETMSDGYTTKLLTPDTWDDFAALVEANNGVWGGCWCMGFHADGRGEGRTPEGNRAAKRAPTERGTVHQVLVFDGNACVGWCQYGSPAELPRIQNPAKYA